MWFVFLDAAVLIAAAGSLQGGSYAILELVVEGHIRAVVSGQVLTEATRNVAQKLPAAEQAFRELLATLPYHMTNPTPAQIASAADCVAEKDAGIVAAAQAAKVDHLISLDKKHLLRDDVRECTGLSILSPQEFLMLYRAELPIAA